MSNRLQSPVEPAVPRDGRQIAWTGLPGSAPALALSRMLDKRTGLVLAVTASSQDAQRLERELRFYAPHGTPILPFPDWETLPYDVFSPHQDIVSQRLATLYRLPETDHGVLIVPAATLMQRLPPRSYLDATGLMIREGDHLELEAMRTRLEQAGYRNVPEVMEHGEFAVRGALLDLYPMGSDRPYRIDLFDNEVDTVRTFDADSQRTVERVSEVRLLPGREFPVDDAAITRFRKAFRAAFEGDPTRSRVYCDVSDGVLPNGIEYYLPLFFDRTASLLDYLPPATLVYTDGDATAGLDDYWQEIHARFEQRGHDRDRPLLPPEQIFLPPETIREALGSLTGVRLERETEAEWARGPTPGRVRYAARPLPGLTLHARSDEPEREPLDRFLASFPGRVLFVAETAGHREALLESLERHDIHTRPASGWEAFLADDSPRGMTVAALDHGMILDDPPLAVIPEATLFGDRAQQRRRRRQQERDPQLIIRDLNDLHIGAPVVHEDHGVGRYQGLQRLEVGDFPTEFLTLEYAGGDKLYVPVASLHLISRYTGAEESQAPLHRLGGDQWEKARRKAARKARDVAAELLDIHAQRAARTGQTLAPDAEEYARFAEAFPFEETPDQQDAIDAVVADLASDQPMDRVVCGDVGFGKTEVAMRAAFVAVQNGQQVAMLVPTTLLAQQHLQSFRDRFADWPVRIGTLSRFSSARETRETQAALADGTLDIVIGTHRLLQGRLEAKRLGLVIIDEEHRFGVRHKEQLKRLRAEVDLLTLTATPIPRTLNMSLSGLRDLSIISTPPARRLAVKTFLSEWNDALIQEACQREIKRGGQVYFLHNDVDTIARTAEYLEDLVPQARVGIAHGQMPERDLERVMLDFYHQRYNVLVCTTIIESGIDIPNANTIVLNRADRFGLAQLHQLRGRVGRSHHRAYAYLIAPPRQAMTADAVKRLDALTAHEDLGVGFTLASHDLEIRGAGELLGSGQSGQMAEVGFSLYNELLERAVTALKEGREPALEAPVHHGAEVDLRLPALIPEDYLPDVHARLVLYKRIANARTESALKDLQVEMIDRFGLLPAPVKNLFRLTAIKLRAEGFGITRVEAGPDSGTVMFGADALVDPGALVELIQSEPGRYRLEGQHRLRVQRDMPDDEERFSVMEGLLDRLRLRDAA